MNISIQPIRSHADYEAALKQIEALMSARKDTAEGDRLEILATLADAYQNKHHPIAPPDPIEAIKFIMEQRGLAPKDLVPMIGQPNRV